MHASGVHVEVLRRGTNESSPEEVYRQIQGFVSEYDIDEDVSYGLLLIETSGRRKCLSEVAMKCSLEQIF